MDEDSKKPGLYETLAQIKAASDQREVFGKSAGIPKNEKTVAATSNAKLVPTDLGLDRIMDLMRWDEDCPAIKVCEYTGNVRDCCSKGEAYPTNSIPCTQGLLLLIAKIHGVLSNRDSEEAD